MPHLRETDPNMFVGDRHKPVCIRFSKIWQALAMYVCPVLQMLHILVPISMYLHTLGIAYVQTAIKPCQMEKVEGSSDLPLSLTSWSSLWLLSPVATTIVESWVVLPLRMVVEDHSTRDAASPTIKGTIRCSANLVVWREDEAGSVLKWWIGGTLPCRLPVCTALNKRTTCQRTYLIDHMLYLLHSSNT